MELLVEASKVVIRSALERYSLKDLALSFNGGKDSVVLLELIRLSVQEEYSENDPFPITAVYFQTPDPFPEVNSLVEELVERYGLKLIVVEAKDIKYGLEQLRKEWPDIKALIVGTRRTDPHGKDLQSFSPTTSGWPSYMRINPLLEWDYGSIWKFIHSFSVPYCCLYEQGYTSLGDRSTTFPNPALKIEDTVQYQAAWFLEDVSMERDGRI